MIIPSKPRKEDGGIEDSTGRITFGRGAAPDDLGIHTNNADRIIQSLRKYVAVLEDSYTELAEKYAKLEKKHAKLEDGYNRMMVQEMDRQNSKAIQDLEEIFGIDPGDTFDPRTMEGALSRYSDDQSSLEWVRSVRSRA